MAIQKTTASTPAVRISDFSSMPTAVQTEPDKTDGLEKLSQKHAVIFASEDSDLRQVYSDDELRVIFPDQEAYAQEPTILDQAFYESLLRNDSTQTSILNAFRQIAAKRIDLQSSLLILYAGQEVPDIFDQSPDELSQQEKSRLEKKIIANKDGNIRHLMLKDKEKGLAQEFEIFSRSFDSNLSPHQKEELFIKLAMRVLKGKVKTLWQSPDDVRALYAARQDAYKTVLGDLVKTSRRNFIKAAGVAAGVTGIGVMTGITVGNSALANRSEVIEEKQTELEKRRGLSPLEGDAISTGTKNQILEVIDKTQVFFFSDLADELIKAAQEGSQTPTTEDQITFLIGNLNLDGIKMRGSGERINFTIPIEVYKSLHEEVMNQTVKEKKEKLQEVLPGYFSNSK